MVKKKFIKNFFRLYVDGFKNMTVGKNLWMIIAIKLFIMFAILKVFIFDESLKTKFKTDKDRADFVILNLTKE